MSNREIKHVLAWDKAGTTGEKEFGCLTAALAFLAGKEAAGAKLVSLHLVETTTVDLSEAFTRSSVLPPFDMSNTTFIRILSELSAKVSKTVASVAYGVWNPNFLASKAEDHGHFSVVEAIRDFSDDVHRRRSCAAVQAFRRQAEIRKANASA